ncbi:Serine/threonine-protein phosphatase 2A activator 2 [Geranomyces michiganensis]|nr:Serine/threonine-protein phosphatase 2A activator 2 [Geranomyces michiganensis]
MAVTSVSHDGDAKINEHLVIVESPSLASSSPPKESSFRIPTRAILTPADLEQFQTSAAHDALLGFIEALSASVRGKTLRSEYQRSKTIDVLESLLDRLDEWTKEIKPEENEKSRFGNPAFQTWYDRLSERAQTLVEEIEPGPAAPELATYLVNSFGNRKRIDYGTGHEAHFITFLWCLQKLGHLTNADHPALVLAVFWRYIRVMRSLQFTYWLEPAGSHGVWGLDDYHFLPFLFGASQLADHKYIRPKAIHDPDIIEQFSRDYMYLACIQFINSVKSASLRWHSPMLDDISGVKTWDKIASGMVKMYRAEVLNKLPIMQHFLFGSLLDFHAEGRGDDDQHPAGQDDPCGEGHVHAFGQEFPDCCGIRVPSAIAAAASKRQGADGGGIGGPQAAFSTSATMPFMSNLSTFTFNKETFWAAGGFMFIKNLLLFINFLSLLAGIILIGGGVYLGTSAGGSNGEIISLSGTVGTAAIVIGVIVTIVSFLGCFGAANEKGMLLKTYFALLIILVILELSVGIAAYSKRSAIGDTLQDAWSTAYEKNTNVSHQALVQIEITFSCCGYSIVDGKPFQQVPPNCSELFGFTDACADAVQGSLRGSLGAIGGAGVVIGVIELIGLIFSAILFRKISQREQAAGSLLNEAWRINRQKITYGYQNYQYV